MTWWDKPSLRPVVISTEDRHVAPLGYGTYLLGAEFEDRLLFVSSFSNFDHELKDVSWRPYAFGDNWRTECYEEAAKTLTRLRAAGKILKNTKIYHGMAVFDEVYDPSLKP